MAAKDLVEVIKNNPGCLAIIDNDCWTLYDRNDEEIACSDEPLVHRGDGYGSGNTYGGDILQALAEIAGVRIESV